MGISSVFISIFIFFSILGVYSFQRLYKNKASLSSNNGTQFVRRAFILITLCFFCTILVCSPINTGVNTLILFIFLISIFISCWYVIPFFKIKLRDVPYLKTPLIAIIWSLMLIYLPITYNQGQPSTYLLFLFFVYFFALAIPFDIKDLDLDSSKQRNIPQVFGVLGAKLISVILMIGFYFLFANHFYQLRLNPFYWFSLLFFVILTLSLRRQSSFLMFVLIDSSMLWLGLVLNFQF